MTQLFPAYVSRANCSYTKEEATSTREGVPIEAFGTHYINEGPVVYEIVCTPISQWMLKDTLDQYTKYLEAVLNSIERIKENIKELNNDDSDCSFIQEELKKAEIDFNNLLNTKTKYEETIKFCETYIIKG